MTAKQKSIYALPKIMREKASWGLLVLSLCFLSFVAGTLVQQAQEDCRANITLERIVHEK